jgi:hypothetical protein
MKKLGLLLFLLIILIAVAIWFLFRQEEVPAQQALDKNPSHVQTPNLTRGEEKSGATAIEAPNTDTSSSHTKEDFNVASPMEEKIRGTLSTINHVPIEFYGRAIDQYGKPVTGAEVVAETLIRNGSIEKQENHSTYTDSNGYFELKGFKGESIGVGIKKDGYKQYLGQDANTYFKYSRMYHDYFKPDAKTPVIFQMWKLTGPEPTIESKIAIWHPYNGTTVSYDLWAGQKVQSGGDLKVTLFRNPQVIQRGKDQYDYFIKIEAIDGGLLECNDKFPYLAPENGYKSMLDFNVRKDDPKWSASWIKFFYLKSRNGQSYARVKVDFLTDSDRPEGTSLNLIAYVNPLGSRNLEFDPMKMVTPARIQQIGLEKAIEEVKLKSQ